MNFKSTSDWYNNLSVRLKWMLEPCVCVCIINIHLVSFNLYLEKITMKQFSTRTKITPHTPTSKSRIAKELIQTIRWYGFTGSWNPVLAPSQSHNPQHLKTAPVFVYRLWNISRFSSSEHNAAKASYIDTNLIRQEHALTNPFHLAFI